MFLFIVENCLMGLDISCFLGIIILYLFLEKIGYLLFLFVILIIIVVVDVNFCLLTLLLFAIIWKVKLDRFFLLKLWFVEIILDVGLIVKYDWRVLNL